MLVTYDQGANCLYLYLRKIARGEARRQQRISTIGNNVSVTADYDKDGALLGIEIVGIGPVDLRPRIEELK